MKHPSSVRAMFVVATIAATLSWSPSAAQIETCFDKRATITGTSGADHIHGTPGRDVIVGLGGNDTIRGGRGPDLICGGTGRDRISGGANHDYLSGGAGPDRLRGNGGDDLFGGTNIPGERDEPGDDVIAGGPGSEQIHAGRGHDTIRGGSGFDIIWGDRGNDSLLGGGDSDSLSGGPGNDTIDGGDGTDGLGFTDGFGFTTELGVTVDLVAGTAVGEGSDKILGVENVGGTDGNDVLLGDDADNILSPLLGNDEVDGRSGRDRVSFRSLIPEQLPEGLTVDLAAGTVSGGAGSKTLAGIEDVTGSWVGDVIRGDAGPNHLEGNYGKDVLEGREGDDVLSGFLYGEDSEIDGIDRGDGGPHVAGDVCYRIEEPVDCETLLPAGSRLLHGVMRRL